MLVTSRSAVEYHAMFDLTPGELAGRRVLDCCAGASSFVADTGGRAVAVAVDPAYATPRAELAEAVWAGLREGTEMITANAERFEWSWYGDPARRDKLRGEAARLFLADFADHPERYVPAALPSLPLEDNAFDLVLCSHMLFTWSNVLDVDWHRAALAELVRVARGEVRVFPLVVQATGQPVEFLDGLVTELASAGHRCEIRSVPYRFQRGANHMLVVDVR